MIRSAAPLDPDIGALWTRIQNDFRANQCVIAESLNDKGALDRGLDVDRATDILWALNISNLWVLLVGECGWTPEQCEQWFAEVLCSRLLRPGAGQEHLPPQ